MLRVRHLKMASRMLAYLVASALAVSLLFAATVAGDGATSPYPDIQVVETKLPFKVLWDRLKEAIKANKMGIVAEACASCANKARGVTIAGNAVVMVYRPDFAARMLEASLEAGIEAPLRFYLTENVDGSSTLVYRKPSAVFAPYKNAKLDEMASELDEIWEKIVRDTLNK
jgi:uncharacterized protein (DUF302 family)